jgi:hypothetical protein
VFVGKYEYNKQSEADERCDAASIPIVIGGSQMMRLMENMPKSVSELNYGTLPITEDSWFKYHGRTKIIVLGGQIRQSRN